jgi:hypothetical protein
MITGGSDSGNTGRPSKPDISGSRRKLGPKGQAQASVVMRTFERGKLRTSAGHQLNPNNHGDAVIAKAIAMSEGRSAQTRGTEERTWKGRTRIRPKKKDE